MTPNFMCNEFFLLVFFWFRDWPSDGVGERTSSSAEKRNIKKQRRFWATHVIRKWTFRIYPNFRKTRLYNLDKNYDT